MGAFLEKPKTDKLTDSGEGHGLRYGVSAMQGWRMEMEDAHVCSTNILGLDKGSFFGVFDGHAGSKVSQYCSENLLDCVMEKYKKATGDPDDDVKSLSSGIRDGFLQLDDKLKLDPTWANGEDRSGTTAIVVMITPEKVFFGNCGDSRALLCRNETVFLSTTDHKPYNAEERQRIEKAGGTVMMQRVNGSLAVSRALGDFDYKRSSELPATEQLVSPEPDITVKDRSVDDQFVLLACDGIFDVMSNEEVVSYVLHHLKLTDDLAKICSDLIDTCLNKNSRDNMSVILITFPSAPKVSQKAIEEEEKSQEQFIKDVDTQLNRIVNEANDPLDLEDNYVITQLSSELADTWMYFASKRQYISEKLAALRKEKFGNQTEEFPPNQDDNTFPEPSLEDVAVAEKDEAANLYNPEKMEEGNPPSPASSSPVENSLL